MAAAVFASGVVIGVALVVLLIATLMLQPDFRLWPTPGNGSWQGYVFWPLFRSLNVLCFVIAILDSERLLGLPGWLRLAMLAALGMAIAAFRYAFTALGRDNSYCAQDGLVTGGIYQWSRNPQNAMLVVVYACLAVVADTPMTYALCGLMITVYVLMVLAEEPWLEGIYGEPYRAYCRQVPRFFNWSRARRHLGRAA